MEYITIGEAIRRKRKAKNLTQAKLAEKLDCDPSKVSRIESGIRQPSRQTMMQIMQCLGGPGFSYAEFCTEREAKQEKLRYAIIGALEKEDFGQVWEDLDKLENCTDQEDVKGRQFCQMVRLVLCSVLPEVQEAYVKECESILDMGNPKCDVKAQVTEWGVELRSSVNWLDLMILDWLDMWILNNIAVGHIWGNNPEEAELILCFLLETLKEVTYIPSRTWRPTSILNYNLAVALCDMGRYEEALESVKEALAVARHYGGARYLAKLKWLEGEILLEKGEWKHYKEDRRLLYQYCRAVSVDLRLERREILLL